MKYVLVGIAIAGGFMLYGTTIKDSDLPQFISSSGNRWEFLATDVLTENNDPNIISVDGYMERMEITTRYTLVDSLAVAGICEQVAAIGFSYVAVTDSAGTRLADNASGSCVAL